MDLFFFLLFCFKICSHKQQGLYSITAIDSCNALTWFSTSGDHYVSRRLRHRVPAHGRHPSTRITWQLMLRIFKVYSTRVFDILPHFMARNRKGSPSYIPHFSSNTAKLPLSWILTTVPYDWDSAGRWSTTSRRIYYYYHYPSLLYITITIIIITNFVTATSASSYCWTVFTHGPRTCLRKGCWRLLLWPEHIVYHKQV